MEPIRGKRYASRQTAVLICIAILIYMIPVVCWPLTILSGPYGPYAAGQVIFNSSTGVDPPSVRFLKRVIGAWDGESIPQLGVKVLYFPENIPTENVLRVLGIDGEVAYAEQNSIVLANWTPNDPYYLDGHQWDLFKINCPAAWDQTQGSSAVKIAVLDTGVTYTHPDLASKCVAGWNFVANNSDPMDDHGHGTHVAGTCAAATNNGGGIAGVGANCMIMPVKVLNSGGSGTHSQVANGIVWAADHGAKVVNMSLGGPWPTTTLENAVNYAWNNGVVVCAAAGNDATTNYFYPAAYTNCIAVAASDSSDNKASFSNYGPWVDVAAPGVSIFSTTAGGYQSWSGTSMASPHVAGEAGLLFAKLGVGAPASTVRNLIEGNCVNVGSWVANGRINVGAALSQGSQPPQARIAYPSAVTILYGVYKGGGAANLSKQDRSYYSVGVRQYGRYRTTDWYATIPIPQGTITSWNAAYAGKYSKTVPQYVYAWNSATGRWDYIGRKNIGSRDAAISLTLPANPTGYIDDEGNLRLRFQATDRLSFTCYADYLAVRLEIQ